MAVLGRGTAYGSCSLLHALGTGYGASLSLDMSAKVMIKDNPDRQEIVDPHGLLDAVKNTWTEADLPFGDDFHCHSEPVCRSCFSEKVPRLWSPVLPNHCQPDHTLDRYKFGYRAAVPITG